MKISKINNLPLDQFINLALYNKKNGYYMKKNPFGKDGDFITAPNITRLFSEIIAVWTITFWKSIGSPKNFNLLDLGAGNGEMMKVIDETLKNFPECYNACNFIIYEKSNFLISEQKKILNSKKFLWMKNLKKINTNPSIFLANEFFDAIPIKQFFKKRDGWIERFVDINDPKKAKFNEKKIDINKIEKNINFKISKNQSIIEYSPDTFKYLEIICDLIQKHDGGMLIIDYGYADSKMHETLQAVHNHKYSNILENIGDNDITYSINFHLFEKFINQFKEVNSIFTNQKKFLTSMGIIQRAEIISKSIEFSKKADLFYRVRRLIDERQMGEIFKVMLIKKKKNNFRTGFSN